MTLITGPRTHTGSSLAAEIVLWHLTSSFSVVQVKAVASEVKATVKTDMVVTKPI